MAINERLIHTAADAAGGATANAEQGLILHLDANDVDSFDGDGSVWYDISTHDVTVPLSDNADDLELHLNASDSTSYDGSGTTWTDIAGSNDGTNDASVSFDKDNGGYFDYNGSVKTQIPHFSELESSARTWEYWVKFDSVATLFFGGQYGSTNATNTALFRLRGASPYNTIRAQVYNGAGSASEPTGTKTINANQWYHVVFVSDNADNSFKIYVDGELDLDTTLSFDINTSNTQDFYLGQGGDLASNRLNGKMGAFRFYSKALSASDIGQNYRHGRDNIYTDLIDDTDLGVHLDAASYSGSGTTWTADAGNDGTVTGATYDQELGDWFSFDGSNDKITIANQSAFHSTNSFTYELWVRKNNTGEDLVLKLGSHPTYYLIYNDGLGYWFLDYASSPVRQTRTGSVSDTIGKWTHVCVVHDPSVAPKIYVNGVYMSTMNISGSGGTSGSKDLLLGDNHSPAGWSNWDGDIGQVRFYSSALSADEVMQNYLFTKNNYPNEIHLDGTNMDSNDWNSDGYFDFDGSSEYFYKNDYPVDFGISDYTIIMWFNSDTNNANKALFSTYNSNGLMINLQSDGTIRHYHDGGTQLQYYTSETISTGTWYQLAVTFDRSNDTGSMYLSTTSTFDSTASTGTASSGATNKGDGGTNVGRYNNGFQFDGKIANVRVYDKALSSSEIQAVWNTDKGNIPT